MGTQTSASNQAHNINSAYDSQHTYGASQSYYGDGKYPPDWDSRRDAVWNRQRFQCARCGVYKGDVNVAEIHHIVHLSDGGSNSLKNLVGLCGDCHAAMHPDVDVIKGDPMQAQVFPDEHADDRVAVIRQPEDDELEHDVKRLSEFSEPDANRYAVTDVTVPTSPETAQQAAKSIQNLLLSQGYVPRVSAYHKISVRPEPVNLLAAISPRDVELTTRSDGTAVEVEQATSGSNALDVYLSSDSNKSELVVQEPSGEKSTTDVELTHDSGSRLRLEMPIHGPEFNAKTATEYGIGAIKYFGWQSLKIGAIPGLILAFLFPSFIPAGGSWFGIITFVLLIGLFIRSPSIYEDATSRPKEQVVNERAE